ncbi:unnamed protein product [Symbiodinium sp. CCMP2592]|nr:unnamed protein product [Symbiodinium sp. CCMP2592]
MAVEVVSTPLECCPFCEGSPALASGTLRCRALGLSYRHGVQQLELRGRSCRGCKLQFLGCWCCGRAEGDTDVPRLACAPSHASWFFMKTRFHANALVALSVDYLRFMTASSPVKHPWASFLHLRASFRGLAKMLPELFPEQHLEPNDCHRVLEHGWFLFETLNRLDTTACIGKTRTIDIRLASLDTTLCSLEPSLSLLLSSQAVAHVCSACANPVLAGDGGMKLTTRLCNERSSATLQADFLQLTIPLGCSQRPCRGSLFCKRHQLLNPPVMPEINCHRITTQGNLQFRYKGDTEFVAVEEVDQRRLRQYDSRNLLTALDDEADAAAGSGSESGQGGARDASPAVLRMHASDTAIDACRCAKDDRKRVAVRKYAGVFVVSLPCGHIVFLHHMVGSESLPQVPYSFAKARELAEQDFLVLRQCPRSGSLLPEQETVLKEKHEVLTDVNTEVQEQVFAWVRWLVYVANPMKPVRHRIFFLILEDRVLRGGWAESDASCHDGRLEGWREDSPQVLRWPQIVTKHAEVPVRPAMLVARASPGTDLAESAAGLSSASALAAGPHDTAVSVEPSMPEVPSSSGLCSADVGLAVVAPVPSAMDRSTSESSPEFVLNCRDWKLHRLQTPGAHVLACGSSFPKKATMAVNMSVANRSLCLKAGCF